MSVVFSMKVDRKRKHAETFDEQIARQFGEAVRVRREAIGLDDQTLADAADVGYLMLHDIELGRASSGRVTLSLMYRIAHALGCHPAELLPVVEVGA